MPPKRTRQSSTEPDIVAKRMRTHNDDRITLPQHLSPVSDMSDIESEEESPAYAPPTKATASLTSTTDVAAPSVETASITPQSLAHTEIVATAPAQVSPNTEATAVNAPEQPLEVRASTDVAGGRTEAEAMKILNLLGVEPGALVGVGLQTLNAIINTMTKTVPAPKSNDLATAAADNGAVATAPAKAGPDDPVVAAALVTALDALVEVGVARERLVGWNVDELKRLKVLLSWADGKRHVYNINTARIKKDWGVASPFNNTSNIICLEGTCKPVTFWIPGEISGLWFFNQEGYHAPRPAITVQPLVGGVPDFCRSQLHEMCMPTSSSKVAEQFGPDQVKASRWMTTRATQGQPAKTQEFKAIFDARKSLRDKAVLQQLSVGQLKLHYRQTYFDPMLGQFLPW
ncbi:hypothetical protein DFH06DRAFT_1152726 [Mycena polygramma]|nr:hypothetical protein DFH06DRAFT_1152726 [Mycena polygramma]